MGEGVLGVWTQNTNPTKTFHNDSRFCDTRNPVCSILLQKHATGFEMSKGWGLVHNQQSNKIVVIIPLTSIEQKSRLHPRKLGIRS
mmetsp:Transcript_12845/g.14754  ORF Transcript_12845/g.14754 Transcript_12845/m.14754 type:complete len:86 (-) Transcript_12845:436-693(-)